MTQSEIAISMLLWLRQECGKPDPGLEWLRAHTAFAKALVGLHS